MLNYKNKKNPRGFALLEIAASFFIFSRLLVLKHTPGILFYLLGGLLAILILIRGLYNYFITQKNQPILHDKKAGYSSLIMGIIFSGLTLAHPFKFTLSSISLILGLGSGIIFLYVGYMYLKK